MRFEQLKYITTIDQYHSISRAADALYITQPTLSRAVMTLENELGVQLFERTKQGVFLTPIGKKLIPYFQEVEEKMESIYQLLAIEHASDVSATLRIAAGSILCNNFFQEAITLFNQNYPLIDVDIIEKYDTDIIKAICENEIDIGFLSISPYINDNILSLLAENRLFYRRILQSSMLIVLSADSPLANEDMITIEQLASYPLILNKSVKRFISNDTLLSKDVLYYQNIATRDKMILSNQGYAIMSALEMYNDYYLRQGLMVAKTLADGITANSQLWLVYNDRSLTFYENDFIDIFYRLLNEANV